MRALAASASIAAALACTPAHSQLLWDVRDGNHPVLGAVRFAHLKLPIATTIGTHRVYSNAYISCEPQARTMAVELTNQVAPDDPAGLKAASMPRLVCERPRGAGSEQAAIGTHWEFNGIGDALTRGLAPRALRACASIGIAEEVVLPQGWGRRTTPILFEIMPGAKELQPVFAACGETALLATAKAAPDRRPGPLASAKDGWKTIRVVAHGKTNVRARPTLHAQVVAHIDPGDLVFAQPTGGEWWRVKSRRGTFEGYVREDRLVLK
ncbi:MAG TPA: SH3 domain-containing protein [Usitatibacter sp.]|nr:SH3 domain-containing protein [Usitatibacter sp.]